MELVYVQIKMKSKFDKAIGEIEKAEIVQLMAESHQACKKNWKKVILATFLDFLFVFINMTIIGLIQFAVLGHLEALMVMTGDATGGLFGIYEDTAEVTSGISSVGNDPNFEIHTTAIIRYLGLMIFSVFILWTIFQSISWYIVQRIANEKRQKFWVYFKNFSLITIPFYLIFVFIVFLSVRMLLSIQAISQGKGLVDGLFIIGTIILMYFLMIAYTQTNRKFWNVIKKTFVNGIKNFPTYIITFVVIILMIFVVDLILRMFKFDPVILMIVGLVIVFPILVYSKVLLCRTTVLLNGKK